MAGHSKWANIQHRKGRQDAARSKLFSKLSKEITVAAKMGDPDPDKNPRLRLAVKEARANSMPRENIDRAMAYAVARQESAFNTNSASSAGAVGMIQLMPATAIRFGVRNRFDIEDNIRGGVAYLAWLIRLFEGDLRLAVAAYFVGESQILLRGLAHSSPEVFRYVSRVAQRYRAKRLETMARRRLSFHPGKEMR